MGVVQSNITSLAQTLVELSFQDQREAGYFRFFCQETSTAAAGPFEYTLWKKLIPQACHEERCLLDCAVAIAALHQACRERWLNPYSPNIMEHHEYALQKYGAALGGIRAVVSKGESALRSAVIGSIMIFCFENLYGNIKLAFMHLKSALDFMCAWTNDYMADYPLVPRGVSPAPGIIEDDLVAEFCQYERQMPVYRKFFGWDVQDSEKRYAEVSTINIPSAPARLTNITEAKAQFELLSEAAYTYNVAVGIHDRECSAPSTESDQSELLVSYNAILEEFRKWDVAFQPLLHYARTPEGEASFVAATTLRAQYLTHMIHSRFKSQLLGPDENLNPQYREIVALCRAAVSHHRFANNFIFDTGITYNLFLVAVNCQDQELRREAMSMMEVANPPREAFWYGNLLEMVIDGMMKEAAGHHGIGGLND